MDVIYPIASQYWSSHGKKRVKNPQIVFAELTVDLFTGGRNNFAIAFERYTVNFITVSLGRFSEEKKNAKVIQMKFCENFSNMVLYIPFHYNLIPRWYLNLLPKLKY